MSNPIISQLRGRYLDLLNREADYSLKYGTNHQAVVNLRNQIRDIRRSIRDELGRIEETFKSEYQLAIKQQDEAEKALAGLVSQSTTTNQAQVALFSLEAAAQSYRKLYDSFLQRHTSTVQQQSLPITDARMISSPSVVKTSGKALQNLMMIVFAGGMLGMGVGVFRELRDRGFRTRDHVRSILDTECLALVPILPKRAFRLFRGQQLSAPQLNSSAMLPVATAGSREARTISPNAKVWESIVDSPASPGAEAIRSLKLGLDLRSKPRASQVVGLTSCLPGEGKSTIASAMAVSIAQTGANVLLIDCDLRNPSLSRMLAPDARLGLVEVLDGNVTLADAVWQDPVTKMDFLPTVADPLAASRIDIFSSSAADSFFKTIPIKYDYVIVDLAPLVAGLDVRTTLRHIDSHVLVIEWGSTKVDQVRYALRHAPGVRESIAGVVLNKVDMDAMSLYDRHGAKYYYGQPRYPKLIMSGFGRGPRELVGNEKWFLVRSKPKAEAKAQWHLGAQGFRTFLPQFEKTTRHARKLRTAKAPLFPGYLFVVLDLQRDRWLSVRSTVGVSDLYGNRDGIPVAVPHGIVETLIDRCDGDLVRLDGSLAEGQSVRILSGPFADMVGNLKRLNAAGRVQVLLEIMGATVPVVLRRSALAPAA